MALTAEQIRQRDGRLTASRVACLMNGDPEKILTLWEQMTGQREDDDLSHIWAVRLGEITEPLNLDWFERTTGRKLTRRGEVVVHSTTEWAAATLDGFDAAELAVVECKCVGGFEAREKVVARYQPQIHWQMIVTETRKAFLSIIEGGKEPAIEEIAFDQAYADELWRRAEAFMQCVRDLTPPVTLAPVAAPAAVSQYRTLDLTADEAAKKPLPNWAPEIRPHLEAVVATAAAAKTHKDATEKVKKLLPDDVGKLTFAGAVVSRNKAGAVSIKEVK